MRARLLDLHSPDADLTGDPVLDVGELFVQLYVGPEDGEGEESFDLMVYTAGHVADLVAQGPLIGRHSLIVDKINIGALRAYLTERVASYEADDWAGLAVQLADLGRWEFEGMDDD